MRCACLAISLFGCVAAARADWQPVEPPPVPPETERAQRGRAAPAPADRNAADAPERNALPARAPQPGAARAASAPTGDAAQPGALGYAGARGEAAQPGASPPSAESAAHNRMLTAQAAQPGASPPSAESAAHNGMLTAQAAQPGAASALPNRAGESRTSTAGLAQPGAAGQPGAQPGAAARPRLDIEALRTFAPAPPPVVLEAAPGRPNTALTSFAPAPEPPPRTATSASAQAAPAPVPATRPGATTRSATTPSAIERAPFATTPSANERAPSATAIERAPFATTPSANERAPSATAIERATAATTPSANERAPSATATSATEPSASALASGTPASSGDVQALDAAASGEAGPAARTTALWSAAALFGVGATFDKTVAGVNPLGFGFGVRADYRILPGWSVGARMLYFVGGSVELPTHDVAMQSWLLAAEGAYILDLHPFTIQPGLALGLYVRETNHRGFATFITEDPTSLSLSDTTRLFLYVAPGVHVSLPLAVATPALDPLTVGADMRLDLAFGRRVTGNIQLLGQLGLRF